MKKFIRTKKTALWFGVALGAVFVGFAALMFFTKRQLLIDANKKSLQVLASEKSAQVNNFFESQKEKQKILASMNVFKEAVSHPDDPAKIEIAKNRINELRDMISRIAIFTSDGVMFVAESGPVPVDYSALPYFTSKDKEIIFMRYYDEYQKKDYYSILGPIYDSVEKEKAIGSIAFNIDLEKVSALMKKSLDDEGEEEVYLIDEAGLLLSNSKYVGNSNKHGILIQEIKSEGAIQCLECLKGHQKDGVIEKHEDEILKYDNYMGDEVYGVHAHIMAVRGCVIAEKNADEITKCFLADYIKKIIK